MCIICLEVMNEKMRTYEARLALTEMKAVIPEDHREDLELLIEAIEWKEKSKIQNETKEEE